ncbi:MAG: RNA-binding S4 domain-containing protein [Candidatus Latescibacterota bacterium]|nr:MAG: RNA-binding S4 domain-containing protein [Candidatus Latescibacterota bacterium]
MRIDLALKYLCILKSRSSAKHLCSDNAILVNDLPVKPSTSVRTGDKITIHFPNRILSIRLLEVPDKQLSKSTSPTYYQQIASIDTRDVEDTPE